VTPGGIDVRTLSPGAQSALDVAGQAADFFGQAGRSLDLALYDVRLPGEPGDVVAGALREAAGRGVAVRLLYNIDYERPIAVPPPPRTKPELLEALPVPTRGVPGIPDLMHHKYVVRDGESVWTGSTNWTEDSWTLQENVIVLAHDPDAAAAFGANFEELWTKGEVEKSGRHKPRPFDLGGARARAWFTPGHGRELSHRIAKAIGRARERVRIASPVITAGPILGTLAQVAADDRVDLRGVVDRPQLEQVFRQWRDNPRSAWKIPLLASLLDQADFKGKPSTPWAPDTPHDFMHAKVTVADDTVFAGSFNLSRSGEQNAENVLELESPELADRLAAFIDEIRSRYGPMPAPQEVLAAG
jgi:phosphatidylserine/phosphatidylglycerophosphate/cardiolipin synthase-like enzyme